MKNLKKKGMLGGVLLLAIFFVISVAVVYAGDMNSTRQEGALTIKNFPADLDFNNPPVPAGAASLAMNLNDTTKSELAKQLANSLTDQQKTSIKGLLNANQSLAPKITLGDVSDLSAEKSNRRSHNFQKDDANLTQMANWNQAMTTGLAKILTSSQNKLFQDSLLPSSSKAGIQSPKYSTYCYYAYYYQYYSYLYAYYWYIYQYYTYLTVSDPYAYPTFLLSYYGYLYSYYGYIYSYYAYYYGGSYEYYSYYYITHAAGFTYWGGYGLSYELYTWVDTTYSYYAQLYGYYAWYYNDADDAYYCYEGY